ncbi:hypothetical protein RHODO2019_11700 [Rhodococcus antarcticus]|jgi:hypothetical protein|uniref:Uncharacterized protein n=1 Tax=Rhodococcus antarcticus TaxID=2987751 RepID=A0ABY6NY49_9NOCA|nr:hypothetical protein [Rhodococcus antarcticus]UZJ23858.1 hypothetical protein RHODO2019_11700 [Rhodococcus antarcticus]
MTDPQRLDPPPWARPTTGAVVLGGPVAGSRTAPAVDTLGRVSSAGPVGVLLPRPGLSRGTRRAHPRDLW